jgi:hypothetical protein
MRNQGCVPGHATMKKSENRVSITRCLEKAHENKRMVNRPHVYSVHVAFCPTCRSVSLVSPPRYPAAPVLSFHLLKKLILSSSAELKTVLVLIKKGESVLIILFLLLLVDGI